MKNSLKLLDSNVNGLEIHNILIMWRIPKIKNAITPIINSFWTNKEKLDYIKQSQTHTLQRSLIHYTKNKHITTLHILCILK